LGGPAPFVAPGTYTVALTSGGKTLDSKTMRVVGDPDVKFAAGEAERYNTVVNDLHSIQRRGVAVASALNALYPQMADVAKKVTESSAPANVKAQFESLNKDLDAVRKKFGVPIATAPAGGRGGGGGGGRGGGGPDPDNVLAKTSTLKTQIAGIWEAPSPSLMRQYTDVKLAMPKAITEANAVLAKASTVSAALKRYDITLTVPPAPK